MASLLATVKVNGTDVSSYVANLEIDTTYEDAITLATLNLVRNVSSAVTIDTGQTVEIWTGYVTSTDLKVFSGYIESFEPEGGMIKLHCKDKLWDLVRKEVTYIYDKDIALSGKISAIFLDLVTTWGLLNADATTVQDSGTVFVLDKFVCNHADIFERCKALAVALDWQFYYRADTDKVYFEPKGYTTNSNTLAVGSNVIKVPKWTYDNTEMANDLTVIGAYQLVETTESGRIGTTAGYTTASILLTHIPESVKVYADAADPPTTLLSGGVIGSTTTYDYSVDKNRLLILPKTAFVNDDYAEIRYSFKRPTPIHCWDQTSIDSYGQFKKTITFADIRTVADAETRGRKYLLKYGTPFIYTTLMVKDDSTVVWTPGELALVTDTVNQPNVNSTLLINRRVRRWPADYVELYVGDKEWRTAEWQSKIEERLKRIEEDQFANQDIIVELVDANNETTSPIAVDNLYLNVNFQKTLGSGFIFDHPTYGIYDTSEWGVALAAVHDGPIRLIWQDNTIMLLTQDTTFKDASATNANWDTANNRISLL